MTDRDESGGYMVILVVALIAMLAIVWLVQDDEPPEPAPSEAPIPVVSILQP